MTQKIRNFLPWMWTPLLLGGVSLGVLLASVFYRSDEVFGFVALAGIGIALLYFIFQCIARLFKKQWKKAAFSFLSLASLLVLSFVSLSMVFMFAVFGPSEDHFADDLIIPEGIDISEPDDEPYEMMGESTSQEMDSFQKAVRSALEISGGAMTTITPSMPSLRRSATNHNKLFRAYIEASPDWHVFMEQENLFAVKLWSYDGEPRNTLHGYISEFNGDAGFQVRCLLCLDRKQWSRYSVQQIKEGSQAVKLEMTRGNNLHESRVMIDCGGVWVEFFEQSGKPERRLTKAMIHALENEFAEFQKDPKASLTEAQSRSRQLALCRASKDGQPFRLLKGMQPGMYGVNYTLNPEEPGSVYLKAFEVTKGTPLSVERLKGASETRMTWSKNSKEKFGAKSGFTIYEGDWGNPYAARFEVWFRPDSGEKERKLAERIFKIEGWQR